MKVIKNIIYILLFTFILSFLWMNVMGCTSECNIFETLKFDVISQPSGAKVYIDAEYYGTTPISLNIKAKSCYDIKIYKDGYQQQRAVVPWWEVKTGSVDVKLSKAVPINNEVFIKK